MKKIYRHFSWGKTTEREGAGGAGKLLFDSYIDVDATFNGYFDVDATLFHRHRMRCFSDA